MRARVTHIRTLILHYGARARAYKFDANAYTLRAGARARVYSLPPSPPQLLHKIYRAGNFRADSRRVLTSLYAPVERLGFLVF